MKYGFKTANAHEKIEQRKATLEGLLTRELELQTRAMDLEKAIEEAQTEEEVAAVDEEVAKLEEERGQLNEQKSKLEGEIAQLEGELEQLNSKIPITQKRSEDDNLKGDVEGMNRLQVRELLKTGEYYRRNDVIEFYEKFRNLRAVSGGELTIPEVVVNRIMDIMGDYTTLYPLVDKSASREQRGFLLIQTHRRPHGLNKPEHYLLVMLERLQALISMDLKLVK